MPAAYQPEPPGEDLNVLEERWHQPRLLRPRRPQRPQPKLRAGRLILWVVVGSLSLGLAAGLLVRPPGRVGHAISIRPAGQPVGPAAAGEPTRYLAAPAPAERPPASDGRVPFAVPILMYHEIAVGPNDLYVSPNDFQKQLDFLARHGYHTVTLTELLSAVQGRSTLPPRPLVISFDDGYDNAYRVAYPMLKKHGFRGVFFVFVKGVGRRGYVTWAELREMTQAGMEIEAHTWSHPDLTRLAGNPARLRVETAGARAELEGRLGVAVRCLAYPYGRYNAAVLAAVRQAGYEVAVTTAYGYVRATTDPLLWPRVRIGRSDSLASFAAKLVPRPEPKESARADRPERTPLVAASSQS